MARLLLRSSLLTLGVAIIGSGGLRVVAEQATSVAGQTAAQTPPPAATPGRPAESQALTAAVAIANLDSRLAALEKLRADYPASALQSSVDLQILITLTNWPDRTTAMNEVIGRYLGRSASATPEARLSQSVTIVAPLITKKVMLDRAEQLLADAMKSLDFEKFATTTRDAAARANRPAQTTEQIETQFNNLYRARGLETLARIYTAKADAARAEDFYKQTLKASPTMAAAVTALVDIYTARNDYASAETLLKEAIKAATTPAAAVTPTLALATVYTKKGDSATAEATLKEVLKTAPTNGPALVALAKVEAARGDHAAALDRFLTAAAGGALRAAADDAAMRAAWSKVHGSDTGLENAVDKVYRDKYPNPVTPEKYTRSAKRTDRLVLLEMFTGSGCGPCVAADLAMDAAMARYGGAEIIALAYHANIPAPDPMVVSGSDGRREYYAVRGVPTFNIDGALGQLGGGPREATANAYKNYVAKIDQALERPADAALSVAATGEGDEIRVTVNVTKLPADVKDLKLHVALAEKELRFTGENGIRFHPVTVRAMAGERGAGLPISATGRTEYTFSLAAIQADVTKTLAAEIEKRRMTEAPGATPREYMADGKPYTTIDAHELIVVAFLQSGAYNGPPASTPQALAAGRQPGAPVPPVANSNVLQAAQAAVVFANGSKGKGGSR